MELTKKELKEFVKEYVKHKILKENIADDLLPGANNKLADISKKVEDFLDDTVEKAGKLADEAEEIMRVDYTQNTSVGERNRLLLLYVGTLRKIRFNLASLMLDLRKNFG